MQTLTPIKQSSPVQECSEVSALALQSILSDLLKRQIYFYFLGLQVQSLWGDRVQSRGVSSKESLTKQTDDLGQLCLVCQCPSEARGWCGCHWDRENPDITFFNLEFLFVWSVNAFKPRELADETTTAISCCPWGILCPSCSLPFITLCSLKRADIPTNMRPGKVDLIEFGAFFWLQCLE